MTFLRTIAQLALELSIVSGIGVAQQVPGQASGSGSATVPAAVVRSSPEAFTESPPPAVPYVTCLRGQVAVSADNATLASVVSAIARCSGAIVQIPAAIGANRVTVHLGPAEPQLVFDGLLNGFADYIIVGSISGSRSVQSVVVKPHPPGRIAAPTVASTSVPGPQTYVDDQGVERLMSGLTPEEATLTPEEIAQRFESARQQQRQLEESNKKPD